jgi:hypothetical protein
MKLRGVNLLAAVFGELQDLVPAGTISTEELLSAAQKLIELSRSEYIAKVDPEPFIRSNYFSHDVLVAFSRYQQQIIRYETRFYGDEDIGLEPLSRLRTLLLGERNNMYLEVTDG